VRGGVARDDLLARPRGEVGADDVVNATEPRRRHATVVVPGLEEPSQGLAPWIGGRIPIDRIAAYGSSRWCGQRSANLSWPIPGTT
jgi:hypothetical protein